MDFTGGACKGKEVMSFDHHGATITEFGAGESQESPFTMLDETIPDYSDIELEYIHTSHNGTCYDIKGTNAQIEPLRKAAKAHGTKIEDGPCADAKNCHKWRGMKTCHSDGSEAWGDHQEVHVIRNGKCLEINGAAIKNAKMDKAIAAFFAHNGEKLEEKGCVQAGYKKNIYNNYLYSEHIWFSLYEKGSY